MAEANRLRQLLVNDESSFATDSGTFGTNLPILSASFNFPQDRIENPGLRERLAVRTLSNIGLRTGGQLTFSTYIPGHLTATTGSLTATWFYTLIADAFGGGDATQVGGDTGTSPSATSLGTTPTGTFNAGGVVRVGTKGDGGGDGQAAVISTSPTLLTALPAAPSVDDTVYACLMAYHDESNVTSRTTKRFLLNYATTGTQYRLLGCQLSALTLNIPTDGSLPTADWTYDVAYWNRTATSFPDSTAISSSECAPVGGGQFFINDTGTSTRSTESVAQLTLTLQRELRTRISCDGAANEFQNVTGWAVVNDGARIEFSLPWENTYETWWDTDNSTISTKHILFQNCTTDGRVWGFYLPAVQPIGNRPSGVEEVNGQNYVRVMGQATEGPTTTSALSRSAWRLFFG